MQVERVGNGVVVMRGVSWDSYQRLDADRHGKKWPRLAYLDGELEIMSPTSHAHELRKTLLARLVEAYAEERSIELNGAGNTTFANRARRVGLAPDECYFVGDRDCSKEPPQLAIEVSFTPRGVDKLEIYRRLGVQEVWFWSKEQLLIYLRSGRSYALAAESELLPALDMTDLSRLIATANFNRQTSIVRAYRTSLR
ncbi:MAG: Uma2 family endonuclease [Kofleriaceae bacterium]